MNLQNLFFTSDTHFRHANVIKYCPETRCPPHSDQPFVDVADMDAHLMATFEDTLTDNTDVVHLGDFAMGQGKVDYIIGLLNLFKFRTFHLIKGNHDPTMKKLQQIAEAFPGRFFVYGMKEFHTLGSLQEIDYIPERLKNVRLCHFPYNGSEIDERQYAFLENDGIPLIHGHVHDAWRVNGNMINVGVDAWDMDLVHAPLLFSNRIFL